VSVVNKFVGEDIKFVIGHFNSGVLRGLPGERYLHDHDAPRTTERGMWNVLIAIVHDKMSHGQRFLAEGTKKTINASGVVGGALRGH
jgi:branched-chain amino acid transport system substrate-binding protein